MTKDGNTQPEGHKQVRKIDNVEEFVTIANTELADMFYISVDDKKEERSYRIDFKVFEKQELQKLIKDKDIKIPETYKKFRCFIYNENKEKILPFKKDDYLMHDRGYFTFDGTKCFSYDDNGNEIQNFSFS